MSEAELKSSTHERGTGILHNLNELTTHRPVVERSWEVEAIENFLNQNMPIDSVGDLIMTTFPPTILVVHGPRGVGKSTLIREIAERRLYKDDFRMILWVNREKFIDLVAFGELPAEIDPATSADSFPSTAGPLQKLHPDRIKDLLDEEYSLLGVFLREIANRGTLSSRNRVVYRNYLQQLLRFQPYLLIVDDFDEGDEDKTPQLCRELERFRAPNKVILTSRSNNFRFSERVLECPVGLLDESQTKALARAECKDVPPYLLVNEDLDDTANWIWSVSGGLPDFITQFLLREVRQNDKHLGPRGDWPQHFNQYALEYLSPEPNQPDATKSQMIFSQLNDREKYILTALASQEPLEALELNILLQMLGVVESDREQYDKYYQSLISLFQKKFLGRRIMMRETSKIHWYWYLLPFTTELIRSVLQDYQAQHFYRERARQWISFFECYLREGNSGQLQQHLKQALADLAWCVDHREWRLAIELGELTLSALSYLGDAGGKEYLDACDRIIKAAESSGDLLVAVQYKLKRIIYTADLRLHNQAITDLVARFEEVSATGVVKAFGGKIAHLYSKSQIVLGHAQQAEEWLQRAIQYYEFQEDQVLVNWARLDLAELYLRTGNTNDAFLEAQKIKAANLQLNWEVFGEQLVKANTIKAFILYLEGKLQESARFFEDALENARKHKKGSALEQELFRAKEFIDLLCGKFDPVTKVDSLLKHTFLPVEMGMQCQMCHTPIRREELFSDVIWLCLGCQSYYHISPCIKENINTHCSNCGSPFPAG